VQDRYAHWLEARPPSYVFELHRECVCAEDLMRATWISVDGAQVVEARDVETGASLPSSDPRILDIDDLFEVLLRHTRQEGASVTLNFAADYGYPTLIHGWLPDVLATQFTLRVEGFEAGTAVGQ